MHCGLCLVKTKEKYQLPYNSTDIGLMLIKKGVVSSKTLKLNSKHFMLIDISDVSLSSAI